MEQEVMLEAETDSETLEIKSVLTWLITGIDFIHLVAVKARNLTRV
jgi:hypothetical protein